MGFFYLDSSVVVKRYVDEPGSVWVRLLVSEPENIVILSEIAIVEVSAALAMSVRTGKVRKALGRAKKRKSENCSSTISGKWPRLSRK
jgi:predicted nucleic acid-binding protein